MQQQTLALLLCLIYSTRGKLLPVSVNPETQRLVDTLGREVFFHGTNVVVKHFPWHPKINGFDSNTTFSEKDMKLLQSLGLNIVRLGMMWPGLEPTRSKYNHTYMKVIQTIVSLAAEHGIYTLLDMHQDIMSHKFCVEGFPDWAVNTGNAHGFPEPLHQPYPLDPKTRLPSREDCNKFSLASYYFSETASVAFQNLYNNSDGLLESWAAFWAKTASGFKDYPSVIGYELINEPWAGDIYANPLLLVPKTADRMNLAPAYEVLSKAIREVDNKHCIFFEGVTWDDFGVGFHDVPGGSQYRNTSVLSYHYYVPPSISIPVNFGARMRDLERLKCGGMLIEFFTMGNDFEGMFKTMDACDMYLQSWIGWEYKPYGDYLTSPAQDSKKCCRFWDEKGLNKIVVQNTSRTYPQAVSGNTVKFHFDRLTAEFTLVFTVSKSCKSKETVIYLNEDIRYPSGYVVDVTPRNVTKWESPRRNQIVLELLSSAVPGMTITVIIRRIG